MTKKTPAEVKAQLKLTSWLLTQPNLSVALHKAHKALVSWQFEDIEAKKVVEPTGNVMFDAFWKLYPRKVGKSAARKAWDKLKPGVKLAAHICKSVEYHLKCEDWRRDEGKFIPHPSTYLNEGRYDDEFGSMTVAEAVTPKFRYEYDPTTNRVKELLEK